jgi:hypothetical protein
MPGGIQFGVGAPLPHQCPLLNTDT